MSNKHIDRAIEATKAGKIKDDRAAHILLLLANHANAQGQCFINHKTLAAEAAMSPATVKRKLDLLQQIGEAQWTPNRGHIGNQYQLAPLIAQNSTPDSSPMSYDNAPHSSQSSYDDGSLIAQNEHPHSSKQRPHSSKQRPHSSPSELHEPLTKRTLRGTQESRASARDKDAPPDLFTGEEEGRRAKGSKKDSPKPAKTTKAAKAAARESAAAEFEEFWRAYPKRKAKADALKAFAKVREDGVAVATLISAAKRYAGERAGQDPQYTKHPATWLNKACWQDETSAGEGGPPTIDGVTGEEIIPTPALRGNGQRRNEYGQTWEDCANAVLRRLGEEVPNG
jgi:hypothetical protein